MKWYKRILIGIAAFALLIVLINVGLNFWISNRLPHIINEANESPYLITYKDLSISLLDRNLKATEIVLVPKVSLNAEKNKAGIYAKIKSIEVTKFNIWDIAFSDRIRAESLIISNPEITVIKNKKAVRDNPKVIRKDVVEPFSKLIYVSDIFLNHGNIRMFYTDNKTILNAYNLSVKLEKISITDQTLSRKLPFAYGKYSVVCDSLYYKPSGFYDIRARQIKTTSEDLKIGAFEMVPTDTRRAFVKKMPREKDQYAVKAKNIAIDKMKWGFKDEHFFMKSGAIVLDGVDANIYRSKIPTDDLTKKKLYNRLLRDIPFDLEVDTLQLKNSKLVYEEAKDFEKGSGILTFNKFNLTATNIHSGKNNAKNKNVKIKVKCRFMNVAPLDVDWTFDVNDQSDGFNIKGRIFNFPAERLIPFTKPYVNAEVKGDLDEVYFNFTGNDNSVKGDFAINYDDLKVSIFKKKDRKKKNKFLTSIANLFVKDDTKDKVTSAEIELERIPEKSFYNFLWRSIAEGLKKILI